MTGLFVRIGSEKEIDTLDDETLLRWVQGMDERKARLWLGHLVRWIRDRPDAAIARSAEMDDFIRRVCGGISKLPDSMSGEARVMLIRVIAEAL